MGGGVGTLEGQGGGGGTTNGSGGDNKSSAMRGEMSLGEVLASISRSRSNQ